MPDALCTKLMDKHFPFDVRSQLIVKCPAVERPNGAHITDTGHKTKSFLLSFGGYYVLIKFNMVRVENKSA